VRHGFTETTLFEARPVFEGPNVSIIDVEFETDYSAWSKGRIREVRIQAYNSGDLPVFPDKMKIVVEERVVDYGIYVALPHAETKLIERSIYASELSSLEKGTYPARVEILSEGVKLASHETQVEIG